MFTKLRQAASGKWVAHVTGYSPLFLCLLIALLLALGTGCRLVNSALSVPSDAVKAVTPGSTKQPVADQVEVQQTLMRFSDEYLVTTVYGLDKLRRGTNELDPAELLKWKILLGSEICSIASGPNSVGNLLDMTVFITVTRKAVEDYWQPRVFGESAQPLLNSCRISETNIWRLAGEALTPEQLKQFRQAIDVWFKQNPLPDSVVVARAVGFASQVAVASPAGQSSSGNVFDLLKVDPMSGLDPAVREITQTRMMAERALYVTQKMPTILRWQIELLTLNAVQMPAVQQLVTNTTQIATSVERFATVAEKLPDQVSTERAEILKALQAQEKDVASLMASGTQVSDSLNTTLTTFDALMKRFGVGETNSAGPAPTNAEPFRIQDYTQTAAQLEATARQLEELLATLDHTLGSTNLVKLTEQAQTGGKEIVNYAFWKGVLFVAVVLLAALIYHFLAARLLSREKIK